MSYFTTYRGPNDVGTAAVRALTQGGVDLLDSFSPPTEYYVDFTYVREGASEGDYFITRTYFQNAADVAEFETTWSGTPDPDGIGDILSWPPYGQETQQAIPYRMYTARQVYNQATQEYEWNISTYQPEWSTNTYIGWFDNSTGNNAVLYGLRNTREYSMNNHVEPVGEPIEFYFTKDGSLLRFGCYVNTPAAPLHESTEQSRIKYYYTHDYSPVLRFTSQVDSENYEVELYKICNLNYNVPEYTIINLGSDITELKARYTIYKAYFSKGEEDSYINGVRSPTGELFYPDMVSMPYDNLTQARSENIISLATIVDYFARLNPDFTSEDVYTTLYLDFNDGETTAATRELDFSSLFGSGLDVHDLDDQDEGTPWNPMLGKDKETDPKYELDENEVERIPLVEPVNNPYGKFNRTYILNTADVQSLADLLTTTNSSIFDEVLDGLKMFGANPINAIVDLRMYPFNVCNATNTTQVRSNITLGRYESDVQGVKLSDNPMCVINLGGIYLSRKFDSFLDYEPYTAIRLYIPYVGTIELKPSVYFEHTLSVNMIIDYTTGACRAVIYRDGIPMDYHDGVIGVSIPVTGTDAAAYANGITGNLVGALGSAAGAVAQGMAGNLGGAVKEGASALGDLFDMSQSLKDVQFQQAGSTSPSIGNWMPNQCHLIISRPETVFEGTDLGIYGMDVGFATAFTEAINRLTPGGIYYGVLPEHIGISGNEPTPTAKERDMIKQALNNGFYVGGEYPD